MASMSPADQRGVQLLAGVEAPLRRRGAAVDETARGARSRAPSSPSKRSISRALRASARRSPSRAIRTSPPARTIALQRCQAFAVGRSRMPCERGDAQAEAREEHHEERRGEQPVRGPLGASEALDARAR